MQYAALATFDESPEMRAYINDTRAIHAIMGRKLRRRLLTIESVQVSNPEGGFYV